MIATTAKLTRFTYPWSLAHMPAVSLPCGFADNGCRSACRLGADQWQEPLLLRAGVAYQSATDFHRRRPPALVPAAERRVRQAGRDVETKTSYHRNDIFYRNLLERGRGVIDWDSNTY